MSEDSIKMHECDAAPQSGVTQQSLQSHSLGRDTKVFIFYFFVLCTAVCREVRMCEQKKRDVWVVTLSTHNNTNMQKSIEEPQH